MAKEMIINCNEQEHRVAVLTNSTLSNLFIERADERSPAGNIYLGKVVRVLPGMQAAFVDIGLERTAFLYVADVYHDFSDLELLVDNDTEEEVMEYEERWNHRNNIHPIEDILKEGEEVLAQVAKEPLGNKGARITTHISLPGRTLVLMPTLEHTGISRKIKNEEERRRLQSIIERFIPEGFGAIARTASEGREEKDLKNDLEYLVRLWEKIRKKRTHVGAPALVHKDFGITLRTLRDFYTNDVGRIVVDCPDERQKIVEFMETFMPGERYRLDLYEEREPIFDHFGIEFDVKRSLNKKVWLKSGGYIVIEETEALCSVDVNTGKYVGKRKLEDTILKTNLEAVKEIAYELSVRNIGGIIIIDFIDMESEADREKVFAALKEELEKDKNKTNIQKISELGLIEMTRQRTGKSLSKILCETCPYCEGRGAVKSKTTICYEILRDLQRESLDPLSKAICVLAHPDVANILIEDETHAIEKLEKKLNKKIFVKTDNTFHQEHFEIIPVN
ncbi:MAG: Rne/Rng family ribonuclease [Deltaproteobacteria bacterium]|nr:Rne/Rng family ribonuclease [Deltaproteobacteria bacterium]